MVKWLTSLFTSKAKVIDDVFDKDSGLLSKTGEWIGNLNFTEEEKAELNAKQIGAIHKFVVDTLDENTDRSKTRREIATFFIKFYSLLIFMTGMTYPVNPEWSTVWFNLATSATVGGLVISISIFFFGSHALSKHNETKNK